MPYRKELTERIKKIGTTKLIVLSFVLVIIVGTILLSLPFANQLEPMPFIDNLFMAVSSTCVTGLSTFVVADQYNIFGQIIILILIQVGGLGLMSILAMFVLLSKSKLGLIEKNLVKDATNAFDISDVRKFLRTILTYTFTLELIGALLFMTQFIPEFGIADGVFKSIFLSVSAFCNAGIDTLGGSSLINYSTNIVINFTVMFLIITGGLGFIVWSDIRKNVINALKNKWSFKQFSRKLLTHTKIVMTITVFLLLSGTLLILILEYENTLVELGPFDRFMASLFNSTTLRTAGFSTVNYGMLNRSTLLLMCFFMLIGGSPGGTAGGLKTTTFAILVFYFLTRIKGVRKAKAFNREISIDYFFKAIIVLTLYFVSLFIAIFALLITEQHINTLSIIFEAFSAIGTVGLSTGITSLLSTFGKVVIIVLMFIGRIGPISMVLVLIANNKKGNVNALEYPQADLLVG